jgi:outer membrane protein TolC
MCPERAALSALSGGVSADSGGTNFAASCAFEANQRLQHCYGNAEQLQLTLSQTIWSYEQFSRLKEANFQAAAAEATLRSAQQNLVLRVAQAYFAILAGAACRINAVRRPWCPWCPRVSVRGQSDSRTPMTIRPCKTGS